jgi:hypothetical protein
MVMLPMYLFTPCSVPPYLIVDTHGGYLTQHTTREDPPVRHDCKIYLFWFLVLRSNPSTPTCQVAIRPVTQRVSLRNRLVTHQLSGLSGA